MTMSAHKVIFITGGTGYIGGSVLSRLLAHPQANSFKFVALARSTEKAKGLESFGVKTAIGTYSDLDILENTASEADFVFAFADCDDLSAAEAILKGMQKRQETTGTPPILIHTSGTGVLANDAAGQYASEKIYDDTSIQDIESLTPAQPHRPVDLAIVAAAEAGYIKSYIVLPSTIYGIADNQLVSAGIQNPHSIQVPILIRCSLDRGAAGMVGQGKNLWPNVHIDEVAEIYIILFDRILSGLDTPNGREGFYIGANGEHSLYDVGLAIGQALVKAGKATQEEPTTFTPEEIQKYFNGSNYMGTNSRCHANRARALGWKPSKTTQDFLESIEAEVNALVSRYGDTKVTAFERL